MSARTRWTAVALAVYVGAIVASNWLITHVGLNVGHGTHLAAVGFGLMAPSGVYAAAVSFPARDYVQRSGGRALGFAAILAGALISFFISSPVIALASGGTYLISETIDMGFYTPLQERLGFVWGVAISASVAIVVDSFVFLHWAGLFSAQTFEGQILGKGWVIPPAIAITYLLRKRTPMLVTA